MIEQVKSLITGGVRALGYEIRPLGANAAPTPPYDLLRIGNRLYVTSEEATPEELLAIGAGAGVEQQYQCPPWQLAEHCRELDEIHCRGVLEGMTLEEAETSLRSWFDALTVGGQVRIVVPDLEQALQLWQRADWNEQTYTDARSDAQAALATIYGQQRTWKLDQSHAHTQVPHRSGYSERLLRFLLTRAGFVMIEIQRDQQQHLMATAHKGVNKGERQVAPTLENIRIDHRVRYELAAKYVPEGARILDVACGVGYGSWMLAEQSGAAEIRGIDLNEGAIEYARQHYAHQRVQFRRGNALTDPWPTEHYDMAVSFETIEHLEEAPAFLKRVHATLKPNGILICSTPNEERMPFSPEKFKYHVRHYTPQELEDLLAGAGFRVEHRFAQPDKRSAEIVENWCGVFSIAVCRKV